MIGNAWNVPSLVAQVEQHLQPSLQFQGKARAPAGAQRRGSGRVPCPGPGGAAGYVLSGTGGGGLVPGRIQVLFPLPSRLLQVSVLCGSVMLCLGGGPSDVAYEDGL